MTLDDRILSRLKDGPARLEEIATYCAVTRTEAARALRRLKYARRVESNVAPPYWHWHATPGCPCGGSECKRWGEVRK